MYILWSVHCVVIPHRALTTEASYERHDASSYPKPHCLFNSFIKFTTTTKKTHQTMHQWPLMRGLLRWHVDYPFKWPLMHKAFPWHEVIMPSMHTATAQEKTSIRRQLRFKNWLYIHRYTELGQATKFALATAKIFPWDTQISEEKIELNWIEVR